MNTSALIKAREALVNLYSAWDELTEAWDNPEVAEVLNGSGEKYPFQKSFDDMFEDVRDWTWYYSDEIDYKLALNDVIGKIESLNVRPSTIARIANAVHEQYKDYEG